MAEYIVARKTRNAASTAVHVLLNLLLGVGSVMITLLSGSPVLGLILVLASKWRVFAVRPRYLWVNIKSSLVDFIVGASIILLTYYSGTDIMIVDILLAIVYCVWLIVIKPRTSETANLIQALIAIFLGTATTSLMTSGTDSILIVLLSFIIGYSASRHVLIQSEDNKYASLIVLICGLVFAEIAWLCHSWMIIYTFGNTGIRIPQLAIFLTLIAFTYNSIRLTMLRYDGKLRIKNVLTPLIFCIVTVLVIALFFSNPIFNI